MFVRFLCVCYFGFLSALLLGWLIGCVLVCLVAVVFVTCFWFSTYMPMRVVSMLSANSAQW